jgi:hypothetical protein
MALRLGSLSTDVVMAGREGTPAEGWHIALKEEV